MKREKIFKTIMNKKTRKKETKEKIRKKNLM